MIVLTGTPQMSSAQPIFPQAGPSFSDLRPSIWELVTQEQLRDLLHPVVRYILSVSLDSTTKASTALMVAVVLCTEISAIPHTCPEPP